MNKDKVSKNVMKRVFKYEKRHTLFNVEVWLAMALGFFSLLVMVTVEMMDEMIANGTTDLLSVMSSDWGLAREYWEILWETIKYELPWFKITESIILIVIVWLVTEILMRRIQKARQKWEQMRHYLDDLEK